MNIVLADGKNMEIDDGATVIDVAKKISHGLAKKAVAGEVNGELVDSYRELSDGDRLRIITEADPEGLDILRHSSAHLMAQAVKNLFGNVQVTIGPTVKDGFYYDFDIDHPFTPEDLERIEAEMTRLSKQNIPVRRKEMSRKDAIKRFKDEGEKYKVELLEDIDADTVSLYEQDAFTDLCRGPHVDSTGKIKNFKLMSVAGAYWRGDEKNRMLQRIYGTSFFKKEALAEHITMLEEAKKRDHRKLGKELKLFTISDEAGAGFPIYLPKGGALRSTLEQFEREQHLKRGYEIVYGPTILKQKLWETSGHIDNYRENMYFTEIDEQNYGVKPMNCLAHILVYNSERHSYRDLPLRLFELGTVHRHEKSGVLHGLMRVRAFTQDDAHLFCRPDQLEEEIIGVLDFVEDIMNVFGFSYDMEVSTRPEKALGSADIWEKATDALMGALKTKGLPYEINEGDGAFYGPKIDIKLTDAIGRSWQCATIQCDFNLPERFDLTYIGEDGEKHRPVMLHRVILGSIDRFIGVLIEHFAGAFPFWIAPTQVKVMSITDEHIDYCKDLYKKLKAMGIRAELDIRGDKIGAKIRDAQMQKIPHMMVIGGNEVEEATVSIRLRTGENKNNLDFTEYVGVIEHLQYTKSLDLWR